EIALAEAFAAVQLAGEKAADETERALIEALKARYPQPQFSASEPFQAWNDAYADAMRCVHSRFPDDPDVCSLFAEALINRTPWQLWDLPTGEPIEGADTLEAIKVLENAMAARERAPLPAHPGQVHV